MKTTVGCRATTCLAALAWALAPASAPQARAGNSGTDPARKHAWAENIGWLNAAPTNARTATVRFDGDSGWLAGYVWSGNVGWIKLGSEAGGPYLNTEAGNWGVNMAADGELSGYAWGENIGWIRFCQTYGKPAVNTSDGAFSGHAWGENIGWISLNGSSPDYGVRTMAFDAAPQGTPHWWLDHHRVTENHDAGDGVPAWRKYVMDTDPNVIGDYLRITSISNSPAGTTTVAYTPASTRRYYTLKRREVLTDGAWSNVIGHIAVSGEGGEHIVQDDSGAASRMFYTIGVTTEP